MFYVHCNDVTHTNRKWHRSFTNASKFIHIELVIFIDWYMTFFILLLLSARDLDIGPDGFIPRDDISRELMIRAIWKRPCINLFITYLARADSMLLPSYNVIAPWKITRRKLCFYYTFKFGVISIKYVIKIYTHWITNINLYKLN